MGVDVTAVARVVGIETTFKDLRGGAAVRLPQQVALVGQGSLTSTYALTPVKVTSAATVGTTYGFGSPLHLAALQLLPTNGDGLGTIPLTVYPMEADPTAGAVSIGTIIPTGTQAGTANYTVTVNGLVSAPFQVLDAELGTDLEARIGEAINANVNMPVIAVVTSDLVTLNSKWEGLSANDITISVDGPANGITFGLVQPVGGLDTPDVATALGNIVNKWETLLVNCLQFTDSTALDAYQLWGANRWGALVKKPAVVVTGSNSPITTTVTAVTDLRKTDFINLIYPVYGSASLPLQIAARAVARFAKVSNEDPAMDYGGQKLTGIEPGADINQANYLALNAAIVAGSSTSTVIDGVVSALDTITCYHPTGEDPPAYRYLADIAKLQNVIFNLDLIFAAPSWDGAPLIPDSQATTNPNARKPMSAKSAINTVLDGLGLAAILSDVETAKKATVVTIDSGNPKRLNATVVVQLSGNTNIISIDLNFGFFFGTLEVL